MINGKKNILKPKHTLPMSSPTRLRLTEVSKSIKGKELFPDRVRVAKKTLAKVNALPKC